MTYANFAYYQEEYLGKRIPEEEFLRMAQRASARLERMTRGRVRAFMEGDPEGSCVKDACCAVAEVLYDAEKGNGQEEREVLSESNDGYSVTYQARKDPLTAQAAEDLDAACRRAAENHLWRTGLLYAGVGHRC